MTDTTFDHAQGIRMMAFMDLLGHDVLNNNQAVLSYLELIAASPCLDQKTRKYTERAASQIRTSALLIESVRHFMLQGTGRMAELAPSELLPAVDKAAERAKRLFPQKSLDFRFAPASRKAEVLANEILDDLVLNVLVAAIQLDPKDEVRVELELAPTDIDGEKHWTLRTKNANAHIPPTLARDLQGPIPPQDRSRMVKMAGLLFAKMMAESMGANLEANELAAGGEVSGCALTLHLRRADQP